jgi:hypothetical protein
MTHEGIKKIVSAGILHKCNVFSGRTPFMLRYAYNHKKSENSYHFIIDSNTGKGRKINFCPWCGDKL